MGTMLMPGGWTMSMAWMPMAGQGWLAAEASFVGMWSVMMVAMMLPSLSPWLWKYRCAAAAAGAGRPDGLMVVAGIAYFLVWSALGAVAFPLGAALAAVAMRGEHIARLMPVAVGAVVLAAGALQFTAWKTRSLICCRRAMADTGRCATDSAAAWRCGLHHGLRCCHCCAGLTAVLLAAGAMDLRVMALITLAITAERLAPARVPMWRVVGAVTVSIGVCALLVTLVMPAE